MAHVVQVKKNPENHKLGSYLEELLQEINGNKVFLEAKNRETDSSIKPPMKEVNLNNTDLRLQIQASTACPGQIKY